MTEAIESKDIVRRIVEREEGNDLVSFCGHDAYFQLPDNENSDIVKKQLYESNEQNREINFVYDKNLNILEIK